MSVTLLDLLVKVSADSKDVDTNIDKSEERAQNFALSFSKLMEKTAKATAIAFGAVSTAVGKLGIDATKSFAEYEQLAGGVVKLYGDASDTVLKNAERAFLTSGMSMNEYMQNATSLSGSLIKSLNGDVQRAAEITDVAMQAISDNINTFGTDAAMVSNAFMGLARQNYMMIDNLKLGYAGTAQGMLELINDSGVLGYELTKTSELAEVGFDKMILAIEEMQKQQGIYGTTIKEALTTIQGSATATKRAWDNVITAIGRGEGLSDALDGLMTALLGKADMENSGFISQITSRVKVVMEGISDFVVKSAPIITEKLPELINSIFPSLFQTATTVLANLGKALPSLIMEMVRNLAPVVMDVISTIYSYVTEGLPKLVESGTQMIKSMGEGLIQGIPEFLSNALPLLLNFVTSLRENFGKIVDAGIDLIMNFVDGLIAGFPALIEYVPEIITNIAGLINDNVPKILNAGIEIIGALLAGIVSNIPNILNNFGDIMTAIISVITAVNWINLGSNILKGIINGVKSLAKSLPDLLKSIANEGVGAIKNINWVGIGKAIVDGIVAGVRNFGNVLKNSLLGMAENAWNGVKNFFGIASPSKLMRDTIGKWIPLGLAEGIDDESDSVFNAMSKLSEGTTDSYNPTFDDVFSGSIAKSGEAQFRYPLLEEIRSLKDAILGMQIVLDSGTIAGEIAPSIDTELGRYSIYRGRGN